MCKMHRDPKLLDWASSFRKAPGNHLNYSQEVLQSSKSCAKKLLAVAGRQVLLRVQRLLCCGWRWPLKDSRYKLILSAAAAGTAGKQKWFLILPSSARVSELTYVTIIGTRYPELDNFQNDIIQFGNYLKLSNALEGAFTPSSGMRHTATSMPSQTLVK